MAWLRALLDQIGRMQVVQSIIELFLKYGWSAMLGGLAAFSGFSGGTALMWIIMAAALTAAGFAHARYVLTEHQIRNSPVDKLRFVSAISNPTLAPHNRKARRTESDQRHMSQFQVGVVLQNISHFPISIIVEFADSECSGNKPPRIDYPLPAFVLLPNNIATIADGLIELKGLPCQSTDCTLKLTIRYGRVGKEKYKASFNGKITAHIQPNGQFLGNYIQWDAPKIAA